MLHQFWRVAAFLVLITSTVNCSYLSGKKDNQAAFIQNPGFEVVKLFKSKDIQSKNLDSPLKMQFNAQEFNAIVELQLGKNIEAVITNSSDSTLYIHHVNLAILYSNAVDLSNAFDSTSIQKKSSCEIELSPSQLIVVSNKEINISNFDTSFLYEVTPYNEFIIRFSKIVAELQKFEKQQQYTKCVAFLFPENGSFINLYPHMLPKEENYEYCIMKLFSRPFTVEELAKGWILYDDEKRKSLNAKFNQGYNYPQNPNIPYANQPNLNLDHFVPPLQYQHSDNQNYPVPENNLNLNAYYTPNTLNNQQLAINDPTNVVSKPVQPEITTMNMKKFNLDSDPEAHFPDQQNDSKPVFKDLVDNTDNYISGLIMRHGKQKMIVVGVLAILALILIIAAIAYISK